MKSLFISQTMKDIDLETIMTKRRQYISIVEDYIKKTYGEDIELVDNTECFPKEYFTTKNIPLCIIGKSILHMSEADVVFFESNFYESKIGYIEWLAACNYNIPIVLIEKTESDDDNFETTVYENALKYGYKTDSTDKLYILTLINR